MPSNRFRNRVRHRRTAIALTLLALLFAPPARAQAPKLDAVDEARSHAVVIMYHRIAEAKYPSTNTRIEQLEAHIKELASGKYNVIALSEVVEALRTGRKLPDRTVAITVDDAFSSVYRELWPRLRAAKLPWTLFLATGQIASAPGGEYMTWDQVRELMKGGVGIGNHSVTHAHLPEQGEARVAEEFAKAQATLEKELGIRPRLMAYPYGEASGKVIAAARKAGFVAAFGQHSGVLHAQADMHYLPRFAINESYGSMERFRMLANALPLYATDVNPTDPVPQTNPPPFGFTVGEGVPRVNRLGCYSSQHGRLAVERLGERRIEVRLPSALRPGRARINCTLPAADGRWRWFGYQFYVPRPPAR
ncbi:MAG: hypothetical protein RL477_634 [Pseudomonadota bacterium]|jgi:peptidoglycan/xylan/chitin deacetylase (PgdA/CDA1 family)